MDMDNAQNVMAKDLINPYQNVEDLRPKESLNTVLEKSADDYLQNYYDINVRKFPQHEVKSIYNNYQNNTNCQFKFLNDANQKSIKFNKVSVGNPLSYLDLDVVKSFEFFKGVIISNLRNSDRNNTGTITKEECINALMVSNINNKIDQNVISTIIDYYNKLDNIDYMKFMAQLLKDCRMIIIKANGKNDLSKSQMPSGNYESFRRENFFNNNNKTQFNMKSGNLRYYNNNDNG
jgi:hypothetical protein